LIKAAKVKNNYKWIVLLVLLLVTVYWNSSAGAEEKIAQEEYPTIVDNVEDNFEPSYITFAGGYDWSRNIKTDDLWYEAQVYVHYNWYDNCNDKLQSCNRDNIFRVYLPIRLQVRQYQSESSPVKTPSYNPGLRVYYWNSSWVNAANDFHYMSLGYHHYSNGQSGPHTINGIVNTDNGSFSTDYLELSYYREKGRLWGKVNFRKYITSLTWEPEQTNYYETSLLELSGKEQHLWLDSTVQLTLGYKSGRKYVSPGVNAHCKDNMQYTAEWTIPMATWDDLKWYVRWDNGYDYYNINYENKINRIQFGLVASTF
jgi:outer membrane phospholipase A